MSNWNREKVDLNPVTHTIRAAQTVHQYGVGALINFPDQTLMMAQPKSWTEKRKVFDDRFAKALNVDYFATPVKASYVRFPKWYFCPRCHALKPINQWVNDARRKVKHYQSDDYHMTRNLKCFDCNQQLIVANIVVACPNGHIDDFPWIEWVHSRSGKPICSHPSLKIKSHVSGNERMGISCSCGAYATLLGAFDNGIFERLDRMSEPGMFRCKGIHPHTGKKDSCDAYPRAFQRSSSSIYFPVTYTSLSIPPYTDRLNNRVENSAAFDNCLVIIADEEPADREDMIRAKLSKWTCKIATELGESEDNIRQILERKWLQKDPPELDVTSVDYRFQEFSALRDSTLTFAEDDFYRTRISGVEYSIPFVRSVSLVHKMRVVSALIGFSRQYPVEGKDDSGFVHSKKSECAWYPGYEVRGEGIFIELDGESIDAWVCDNPLVRERVELIQNNYNQSLAAINHPRKVTPKFVLLHTISHLLLKQLSFDSGYNIASLSERLYCADIDERTQMAGIFIYTASGDSEGTLGGLVRQGRPDMLPKIFEQAIQNARICSNDPVCILSRGQGQESLNLAACYACGLLPETCCEERNRFLDRGLVVGTFDAPQIGLWSTY